MALNQADIAEAVAVEQSCLLAFWMDNRFFDEDYLEAYFKQFWSIPAEVIHRHRNCFVVKFESREEALAVLYHSPYAMAGGMLAFRR